MNKEGFLKRIKGDLRKFNQLEVEKALDYYEELINDKVDSGLSEEEAINSLGDLKIL